MMKTFVAFVSLLIILAGCTGTNNAQTGTGKPVVLLDSYFNNEQRKDSSGKIQRWHYKWDEQVLTGFSLLDSVFKSVGAVTQTLMEAPTSSNLSKADVYIIVDPDTKKETDNPNFIRPEHIEAIYQWVNNGGVLLLMANDSANAELDHFNELAGRFGITFNKDNRFPVIGRQYEMGAIMIPQGHPILKSVSKIYIKEMSTQKLSPPATAILTDKNDVLMSVSKVGKGTVFAVGDPWLYNEYVDRTRLTPDYQNIEAAGDLARWLLAQVKK